MSLGFSHGDELRYQYMLEGAETDVEPAFRSARGELREPRAWFVPFLVRAVNSDGGVSDTPASVSFTVRPPVWWRWWFITLVALTLSAATTGCTARA